MQRLRDGLHVQAFDTVRVRKDGSSIDVAVTVSPLMDKAGAVVGASRISRDISPQKEAEKRIYGLMAELKESDRRKDLFLATLAHEIRGPLAPIRNYLEILKRAPHDGPTFEQARTAMDRQVSQVERLVDDLLDLSRITHNRLELRRRRVALGPAIDQAVEACRPVADRLGHELRVELCEAPSARLRGPGTAHPGGHQPPDELVQVHGASGTDPSHHPERRRGGRDLDRGQRDRDRRQHAASDLRAVRAVRSGHGPIAGWPGHRAGAGQADRGDAPGDRRRVQRGGWPRQ